MAVGVCGFAEPKQEVSSTALVHSELSGFLENAKSELRLYPGEQSEAFLEEWRPCLFCCSRRKPSRTDAGKQWNMCFVELRWLCSNQHHHVYFGPQEKTHMVALRELSSDRRKLCLLD